MSPEKPAAGSAAGKKDARFWLSLCLAAILAIVLLVCIYYTIQIILYPEPIDSYTELYIMGPEGRAENYPRALVVGENRTITAWVVNHENDNARYNLAIKYNNSSAEETAYEESFVLSDNTSWNKPFLIQPDLTGKKVKIAFQLYKGGDIPSGTPYRECYMWVNVTEPYKYSNATANQTGNQTGAT